MLTSMSAHEDSGLPSVAAAGTHGAVGEASPERRREFDDILARSLPRFRRIAMRSLRNAEDAEDAVQDAMLSAFRHIARFDGRAQMSTWLTAIVINAVRMQIRRRPRGQMLSLDQSPEEGQWAVTELLADPRPTPEQAAEELELHRLLAKLTGRLPQAQRTAIQLRLRDDLSIQAAADKLGVPEGTLKAQLARGRATLAERFHKATRARKPNSAAALNAGRKVSTSGYRRDRRESIERVPVAVLGRQGVSEAWVSA